LKIDIETVKTDLRNLKIVFKTTFHSSKQIETLVMKIDLKTVNLLKNGEN